MADSLFERVGEAALKELDRRLSNPLEAEELAGSQLMQLAQKYVTYLERKQAQEDDEGPQFLSPLEAVEQEGLSPETSVSILKDYIEHLEGELKLSKKKLKEVEKIVVGNAAQVQQPRTP